MVHCIYIQRRIHTMKAIKTRYTKMQRKLAIEELRNLVETTGVGNMSAVTKRWIKSWWFVLA